VLSEIGFVLCRGRLARACRGHLALDYELSPAIGFVFSTPFVSDFDIRASDFRAEAGDWFCLIISPFPLCLLTFSLLSLAFPRNQKRTSHIPFNPIESGRAEDASDNVRVSRAAAA
ncbi:MAG: hypothetical protein ACYSWQ_17460, partial [Planctomycetota bacterium]